MFPEARTAEEGWWMWIGSGSGSGLRYQVKVVNSARRRVNGFTFRKGQSTALPSAQSPRKTYRATGEKNKVQSILLLPMTPASCRFACRTEP